MTKHFRQLLDTISPIGDDAWNTMEQYMASRIVKKHEHIWRKGEVCRHLVFVGSGLFRNYYFSNEKEITIRFFMENSMFLSYESFITQQPSEIAFEALEESEIITIPRVAIYDLYEKFKSVDRLGRVMAERGFVEIQNLRELTITLSPEEKFEKLLAEQPQLMKRVSQNYIASYLGMTPEHLSRVKKKRTLA